MKAPVSPAERKRPSKMQSMGGMEHAAVHPLADHGTPAPGDARDGVRTPAMDHDFSQVPARTESATCTVTPTRCPFGGACHTCPAPVQAKLAVGQPGNRYEQEADRVAEGVVSAPGIRLQRRATSRVEPIHVPPVVREVLRSPGRPLDLTTRAYMEPRFGHDFSQVQVHTSGQAAEAARSLNARAFTIGRHIAFDRGQYASNTAKGRRLLAHELTHVVQQGEQGSRIACKGGDEQPKFLRHIPLPESGIGDITDDQIRSTEEFKSYMGFRNVWQWQREPVAEQEALLACRLILRDLHSGKRVDWEAEARYYLELARNTMIEGEQDPTRLEGVMETDRSGSESATSVSRPARVPPFFGLSAAPDAFHGIALYFMVTALPHTDWVDRSMLIHRRPYLIVPDLRRNPDGTYSIVQYRAFRNEPGLISPTNWNEFVIGPDSIEQFLSNLNEYTASGSVAYMFGPPAPNAIEGVGFVGNLLVGQFSAAARSYGRSLYESIKDPGWWVQMLTAAASVFRGPPASPRAPAPQAPIAPSAPPTLTIASRGGGALAPAVVGRTSGVVGRTSGMAFRTEGTSALAVRPVPAPIAPPAPAPLRLVPPATVPGPAPAPAGPFIPPHVAVAVTGVIAAGGARTAPGVGPATQPQLTETMTRRGCSLRPTRSLGDDPLATLFCQVATNTAFSYWIESPVGRAEIDALRGNTWYECKCGYGSLVRAYREGQVWAYRRLDTLDEQVLRHQRIARHCGLIYQFITSNREFADLLRERWFSSVDITVVPFEPCD